MRRALLAAALALAACAGVRDALAPAPAGKPSGRAGWVVYALHEFRFEAPAAWRPAGGERRVSLEQPEGRARLEVSERESRFVDERACLADAGERLRQQAGTYERARRYPTRVAAHPAQALEGDQGGWHVWAYAICDGGVQYRIFFAAASPASPEALEAYRTLVESARIGGQA